MAIPPRGLGSAIRRLETRCDFISLSVLGRTLNPIVSLILHIKIAIENCHFLLEDCRCSILRSLRSTSSKLHSYTAIGFVGDKEIRAKHAMVSRVDIKRRHRGNSIHELLKQSGWVIDPQVLPGFLIGDPFTQCPDMPGIVDLPESLHLFQPLLVSLAFACHS